MNASLLEMVLAIALSGLIFASALIPTTQSMVAYQEAELDLQSMTAQTLALARAEQLAGAIWRDPNAPPDGAGLSAAAADQMQVGTWGLRQNGGHLEQQRQAAGWAVLAPAVQNFSFQYLLRSGVWTAAPRPPTAPTCSRSAMAGPIPPADCPTPADSWRRITPLLPASSACNARASRRRITAPITPAR